MTYAVLGPKFVETCSRPALPRPDDIRRWKERVMAIVMEAGGERRSLDEVHGSVPVSQSNPLKRLFAFMGPAYLVSVGYMDPGNWATDLEGGARYGYALLWVLLMSNMMAVLLQTLSARLGVVTG